MPEMLRIRCPACGATNRVPPDNSQTAARFDLRSIPALLVLKDGREVDRLVGVQPKHEIARRLEKAMA